MVRGFTPPDQPESGIHNKDGITKFGDVAYFPGTGPVGKACDNCWFMVHSRGAKTYGKCEKVMMIRRLETIEEVKYIDRSTRACKFFGQRPEGVKPWERYDDLRDLGDAAGSSGPSAGSEESAHGV